MAPAHGRAVIYYLVNRKHAYTIATFVQSWGRSLAGRIAVGPYDGLLAGGEFPPEGGVFIFSDLDRLGSCSPASPEREALGLIHDRLERRFGPVRVLNDPMRSLLRFELLRALHERGLSRFNAYRLRERAAPARFPVFVRPEFGIPEHPLRLLNSPAELRAATEAWQARTGSLEGLLAIEFCDTADASGVYRKYGAFVVGERIVPRHLFFSRAWHVALADLAEPGLLAEERAYLEENPHARELAAICRLARISYGRIDYGVLGGRPQLWEINTNPMIASEISAAIPARRPVHLRFVEMFTEALAALDPPAA